MALTNFKPRETEKVIVVKNPLVPNFHSLKIAMWRMDRNGYPFYITFADEHMACENKEALEDALKSLLSDPEVGKTLYTVMNLEIHKGEGSESIEEKDSTIDE